MAISLETDEALVRYLMGELPEEETLEIERAYFADDSLFGRLLALDHELTDAYVRDELDPDSRAKLEKRVLASPARLEKVEFAKALQARVSGSSRGATTSGSRMSISPFPALGVLSALAAAAAVLLLISAIWLLRRAGDLQRRIVQESTRQAAMERRIAQVERLAADQQARLADHSTGSRRRLEETPPQQRPPRPQREISTASFLLTAGLLRDLSGGNQITVPADAELVRLELAVEVTGYPLYRGALAKADGEVIWSRRGLKPRSVQAGEILMVTLSARLLSPGDYILTLQGQAASGFWEDAEYFSFRVLRP